MSGPCVAAHKLCSLLSALLFRGHGSASTVQNARQVRCLQVLEIYELHGETTVRVVTAAIPCVPQRRQGARNVF